MPGPEMEEFEQLWERLRPQLRAIASRLSTGYADDLLGEMALALIRLEGGHADAFYLRRAKDRAVDWLRKERCGRRAEERRGGVAEHRHPSFPTVADIENAYSQDYDFLAANFGWD